MVYIIMGSVILKKSQRLHSILLRCRLKSYASWEISNMPNHNYRKGIVKEGE